MFVVKITYILRKIENRNKRTEFGAFRPIEGGGVTNIRGTLYFRLPSRGGHY
jgi:hypothetical protein